MAKKIFAALLCAAMLATATVPAYAELQTSVVMNRLAASPTIEWDGKSELEAGKKYMISKNVTVSKKVTIPSGCVLTVKKGAKLWVSAKGALYVKGTLNVKKGGILAVSGVMKLYSGKKLTSYGEVRFGSKSDITLGGRFTAKSGSLVTGEPYKLTLGKNLKLTLDGVCETSGLLPQQEPGLPSLAEESAAQMVLDFTRTVFTAEDFTKAFDLILPDGMPDAIREEYDSNVSEGEMGFDETMLLVVGLMSGIIQSAVGGIPTEFKWDKYEVKPLDPAELTIPEGYAEFYKNITAAAEISGDVIVSGEGGSTSLSTAGTVVLIDDKWYMLVQKNAGAVISG